MGELGFENILRPPFDRDKVEELLKGMIDNENATPQIEKSLRKIERLVEEDNISAAIQLLSNKVTQDKTHFLRSNTLGGTIYLTIDKIDRARGFLAAVKEVDPDYSPARHLESKSHRIYMTHPSSVFRFPSARQLEFNQHV